MSHNYTTFFLLVYKKRANLNSRLANTRSRKNAIKIAKVLILSPDEAFGPVLKIITWTNCICVIDQA